MVIDLERAKEIAASLSGDEPPHELAHAIADACGVSVHCVLLTYAYDHPSDGGEFGIRAEVTLRGGKRPERVHGDGRTPAETLTTVAASVAAHGKAAR